MNLFDIALLSLLIAALSERLFSTRFAGKVAFARDVTEDFISLNIADSRELPSLMYGITIILSTHIVLNKEMYRKNNESKTCHDVCALHDLSLFDYAVSLVKAQLPTGRYLTILQVNNLSPIHRHRKVSYQYHRYQFVNASYTILYDIIVQE